MAETRCDDRRQIAEMEDKVYVKADKAEDMRRDISRKAAEILAEDKEKVEEVRRLASRKMAEKMLDME